MSLTHAEFGGAGSECTFQERLTVGLRISERLTLGFHIFCNITSADTRSNTTGGPYFLRCFPLPG